MNDPKTFSSVGALAERVGITRQAVLLRLGKKDIEPDALVHLPGGRSMAVFDDTALENALIDTSPKERL